MSRATLETLNCFWANSRLDATRQVWLLMMTEPVDVWFISPRHKTSGPVSWMPLSYRCEWAFTWQYNSYDQHSLSYIPYQWCYQHGWYHLHNVKIVDLNLSNLTSNGELNNWGCLNMVVDARTSWTDPRHPTYVGFERGRVPISRGLTAVVLGRTGPIRDKLDIQCLVDADLENQLSSGWLVTWRKARHCYEYRGSIPMLVVCLGVELL